MQVVQFKHRGIPSMLLHFTSLSRRIVKSGELLSMLSVEIGHIGGKLEFGSLSDLCRLLELNARVKLCGWVCQVLS